MRRVLLLAFLSLALPIAALADSITFNATGALGATSGSMPVATSTGSVSNGGDYTLSVPLSPSLGSFTDNGAITTAGNISFDSGTLSKTAPNTYTFTGTITVNPTAGTALFTSSVTGTITTTGGGKNQVVTITGSLPGGGLAGVIGAQSNGRLVTIGGNTITAGGGSGGPVVPEPGTLGLLGTGLVGIAGLVRRKLKIS